ncbi:DegT/DnrJ/EryC1/StrS family aminotransferase [Acinetobacter schindleri]|uniref:DegT/DnrJ/EryC1/StrS family aminotransferase n=1 Tax=Acinetobacter schindleri TaxID=108981 RepID=UPI003F556206
MIPVVKPYLPNREKLDKYIDGIYERNWLTNNGPLVQELTTRLEDYLGVQNLLLVTNGTLALQVAFKALGINEKVNSGPAEAITTPFSFIATASSLKWEGIDPIFVDIDPDTWCLDPKNIESAITQQTRAIVPVHVFGSPCDVDKIQNIADKYKLKVIYDAAHAFGVEYKGKSVLNYGDASILSFHATKLFHTIEGGAIIFKEKKHLEIAKKIINFGMTNPENIDYVGINAKLNEFNAAMGLCVLDDIHIIKEKRKKNWFIYNSFFEKKAIQQKWKRRSVNNYSYYPVVLKSEKQVLELSEQLLMYNIQARRYFSPSLNTITVLGPSISLPISQDLSSRILCLPLYADLDVEMVINNIKSCVI